MLSRVLMPLLRVQMLIVIALATFTLSISGQTTTGTIAGTVVDSSGSVITGAKVSVTDAATGDTRSTETTSRGDFTFPALLPATYTVQVEMAGFQVHRSTGNVLTP
ncbi:MAG: carboxypeptidase-like regulatory domain-containing protein [Acidobacteriota bacterium]